MTKKEMKYFEKLLLEKKEEILKELGYLEDKVLFSNQKDSAGDLSGYSFHMADQATDSMDREQNFLFASREGRFLQDLNDTLDRIKDGTYGKCFTCDKQITKARLEAVPHARNCMKCKTKAHS